MPFFYEFRAGPAMVLGVRMQMLSLPETIPAVYPNKMVFSARPLDAFPEKETDSTAVKTLLQGALKDKIDDRELFKKGIDYSYYYEQED